MNLKTYRAPTMAAALADVKKDLGQDAVILHTRTYKVGAVMGLGGKNVVEITASDQASARQARRPASRAAGEPQDTFVPSSFTAVRTRTPLASSAIEAKPQAGGVALEEPPPTLAREPRPVFAETPRPVIGPIGVLRAEPEALPHARIATTRVALAPADSGTLETLQEELCSIKRLVGQVLECSRRTAATVKPAASGAGGVLAMGGMSDPLFAHYMRLQEACVPAEIAESIAGLVRDELAPSELADETVVRPAVLRRLAERLPTVGAVPRAGRQADGRPLTIALVGPTGVGKTTTIAKLAAMFKLRHNKRVALITSDTYRIAAVDQLRTYANIIGLPLKVVLTPTEMSAAIESLQGHDVVLIDSAGRSQHDTQRVAELGAFVQASNPHETHLVLSTNVSEAVLVRACEKFGALGASRVLFTKLDEAVHLGPVASVLARMGVPASFVTTGQEVPDQIELASSERLARMILDAGREVAAGSAVA